MKLSIKIVISTDKQSSALKTLAKLSELIAIDEHTLEKYHKGGIRVSMLKELVEEDWSSACLSVLSLAQSFGRSWTLVGNIEEELLLIGNEFSISGIEWAELSMLKNKYEL